MNEPKSIGEIVGDAIREYRKEINLDEFVHVVTIESGYIEIKTTVTFYPRGKK